MANRFLNNITINDEYTLPAADGTTNQVLTTDGAGQLVFVDQDTIASGSAEVVEVPVKNLQGSALTKGDPVYISGSVGSSGILEVQLADAGNAAKMPAVGLLKQDLAANAEGFAVVTGKLRNLITSPIDGVTPNPNTVIYVKSGGSTGAALTTVKPGGSTNFIQNVGKVGRPSTSADGTLVVSSILRSNDVPNLPLGRLFVGTNTNTSLTSDVVYIDDANDRVGIGTTSPGTSLQVNGTGEIIRLNDTNATANPFLTFYQNGTRRSYVQHVDSGDNFTLGSEYGGIRFLTGTGGTETEKVRILSNGNVGIGTTNPLVELQIGDGTADSKIRAYYNDNAYTQIAGYGLDFSRGTSYFRPTVTATKHLSIGQNIKAWSTLANYATGSFQWSNASSELMRLVSSTGNLGIGTTSPTSVLHIKNSTPEILLEDLDVANRKGKILANNGNLGLFADTDNVQSSSIIYFNVDGSEKMRITNTGNVGIGTTSPSVNLHVESSTSAQFKVGNGTQFVRLYADADEATILADGSVDMRFYTGGSEKMRINTSGNVGIGQTNPQAKLDVNGKILATWGEFTTTVNQDPGADDLNVSGFGIQGNRTTNPIYVHNHGNGGIRISSNATLGTANGMLVTDTSVNIAGDLVVSGGDITLSGTGRIQGVDTVSANTDAVNKLYVDNAVSGFIDGSGTANYVTKWTDADTIGNSIIYDDGTDIGISTSAPTHKLHVNGDARVGTNLAIGNTFGNKGTNQGINFESPSTALQTARVDADAFRFYFGGTGGGGEVFRILEGGNVGIGTTSPSAKLDVVSASGSSVQIRNTGTVASLLFAIDSSQNSIYSRGINSSTARDLRFIQGSAEAMRITSAGNVGIGTTGPSAALDVQDVPASGTGTILNVGLDASNPTRAKIHTESYSGALSIYDSGSNEDVKLATSGNSWLNGGNVGIGTASPSQKLTVEGNIELGTGGYIYGDTTTPALRLNSTSGSYLYYGTGTYIGIGSNVVVFRTSSSERMRVNSSGNVGIGETSVDARLHITTASSGLVNQKFESAGSAAWRVGIPASQTYFAFDNANDNLSAPKVVIDSSGNVGIGTTSPVVKIESAGTIYVSGNTPWNGGGTEGNKTDAALIIDEGDYIYTRDSGVNLRKLIGKATDDYINIGESGTSLIDGIRFYSGSGTGTAQFRWFYNTSEIMRLNNTGLGIGTTSPTGKLNVNEENGISTVIISRGGTNLTTGTALGNIIFPADYNGTPTDYASINAYANALSSVRGSLDFKVKSTSGNLLTGMTVYGTNAGINVGIGTTSPDYKLDVAGTIGMDTYLYHNGDADTFIGYSANDTFDVNAGGVKQLSVTSDNVNITDTLSYTYPTATGQYNGEIVTFGTFDTKNGTILEGDVIVYTTAGINSGWMRAQGNVTYSKGMLGIAMGTTPAAGILIKGFARNAAFASGGLGSPLYLSPTSAGDTTSTVPSSTNNIVRIVGYMLNPTNDEIFFDPDKSWVQVS